MRLIEPGGIIGVLRLSLTLPATVASTDCVCAITLGVGTAVAIPMNRQRRFEVSDVTNCWPFFSVEEGKE